MRACLIALPYLSFISLGLPDGLFGVAWPAMQESFYQPIEALGYLLAGFWFGYMVSSLNSGMLLRAIGVGILLSTSTAATAASLYAMALSPTWWPVLAAGLLSGAGSGAVDAGLNTYAAANYSRRTLMWLHACFGVGTAAGALLITVLIQAGVTWRLGFTAVATFQAMLAVLFAVTRNHWGGMQEEEGPGLGTQADASVGHPLLSPRAWLGAAAFFVTAGIEVTAGQWAFSLLTLSRGMAEGSAGTVVALYWIALTLGGVAFGILGDNVRSEHLLRGCMSMLVCGSLLACFAGDPSATGAGIILVGLSLSPVLPAMISGTVGRVGEAQAGHAIGFQIAAAALGGAAIPAVAGVLGARFGLQIIALSLVFNATTLFVLTELMNGARQHSGAGTRKA